MKIGLIGDSLTNGRPGVSFVMLLQEKYPNITLDNLGKPGETVKSLHDRLAKEPLHRDYELIFLWIGVNDVYSKLLKVQAQPVFLGVHAYLRLNGNAKEAVKFYEDVLKAEVLTAQTYGDLPENPEFPTPEEMKNLVIHAQLKVAIHI